MKRTALLFVSMVLCSPVVRADVLPPETEPCATKTEGTACTYRGESGVCAMSTCSRIDYSKWDRDASASPPSTSYACKVCQTTPGTTTSTVTGTTTTSTITETTTTSTVTGTTTSTGTKTDDKNDGGCHMGGGAARMFGPWLMAGTFSLLFVWARRRRAK